MINHNTMQFGLIGKSLVHSFSPSYFTKKFTNESIDAVYKAYEIDSIDEFPQLLKKVDFQGLNVTIPFKEAVIPFLDEVTVEANEIGAVNTIKFTENGLKGYNTDAYGFKMALQPLLQKQHKKALVLGTGGASKAVVYVLEALDIPFKYVSRNPEEGQLSYNQLDKTTMAAHTLIINCTPLGTFPDVGQKPDIPYEFVGPEHLLFDLTYNPEKTAFLQEGELRGAAISNGYKMLELQAEKAWEIWNS